MASAWTLLYNRRYHTSRKSEFELETDDPYAPDRDSADLRRSHHHGGHRRHHNEDRDPHLRSHCTHRAPLRTEPEPVQLNHCISESGPGDGNCGGAVSSEGSRLRLIRNNQLPGVVLQARARLLERLRGCSLSGSREVLSGSLIVREQFAINDDFTISDSGEREAETERQWFEHAIPYAEFAAQTDLAPSFHDVSQERTPSLSHEDQYRLQQVVFRNSEESEGTMRDSVECCICLERFQDGDALILLHCAHRFHTACLEPWMLTTGNCPCCRTRIAC